MPLPERELIASIRRSARPLSRQIVTGIGDDCAVVRPVAGEDLLITTDFTLEDVHFRREWFPPESVGWRCATRGLSDIASMGGSPIAAFLSLALPSELDQPWVDGFIRGFRRLLRSHKVPLAGGDTAQSPAALSTRRGGKILADVILLGSVPRGKAVLRSGARPGDDIYVTGNLGSAVAALDRLREGRSKTRSKRTGPGLSTPASDSKLLFPVPRVPVGRYLREHGLPSAMIDISDGLSTDLAHICEESKVGAWLAEPAIPVAKGATLADALHGGDEYELLFTAPAACHDRIPDRIAGVPIHWLGTITKGQGLWVVNRELNQRRELKPQGWQHLKP